MNSNIGLMFHKRIYLMPALLERLKAEEASGLIFSYFGKKDEDELAKKFEGYHKAFLYKYPVEDLKEIENAGAKQRFTLYTRYPGLLVGSGYPHETGTQGDFKMGYFFDHTSGQPVIPGSSVKGVLKNFLEEFTRVIEDSNLENIRNQVKELRLDKENLSLIFGEQDQEGKAVFYDAVIKPGETRAPFFFSNDFITPHTDPLKNPNPNMFLKVLPNVAFEFRFDLDRLEKPAELAYLFEEILCMTGIGAKTNVGYGQFDKKWLEKGPEISVKDTVQVQNASINEELTVIVKEHLAWVKERDKFEGKIVSQKKDNFIIEFLLENGETLRVKKKKIEGGVPEVGKEVEIVITSRPKENEVLAFTATLKP